MTSQAQSRKLLARLEARSLSIAESKPPRADIGTAADAQQHAPPRTKEWRRQQRVIDALRRHLWGRSSRVHASTPTKSLRDPEATENIDIAGALAFAGNQPDGVKITTRNALRRRLAVAVFQYRNWPSYAHQNEAAMRTWTLTFAKGLFHSGGRAVWKRKAEQSKRLNEIVPKIAETALEEFMSPDHCADCGGHGTEQTGVRVGQSCGKCGGAGVIEWSTNSRVRALHVRKQDWGKIWSIPYLTLLDHLIELEREGAVLHGEAFGE